MDIRLAYFLGGFLTISPAIILMIIMYVSIKRDEKKDNK